MSFMDTLKIIANAGINRGEEVLKASKMKFKNKPDKILGGLFEKVDGKNATEMYEKISGYKLNKTAGIVGALGVTGLAATSIGFKAYHKGSLGYISGGELPNTVNQSRTPKLMQDLEKIGTPEGAGIQGELEESMNLSQEGVEPEIVFALHQLRN
ncbi:hypothetical protein U729_3277 (plasmid) [Clostridium baratii str. Sullivan]|uniref:Uncharacterized protein n=1 Tax=Clostridium baratii str. Sullivan TaxID=1415775 RepID=A0A0A7G079_9CLOT|nr:hypothetical protein [Clostridium baratii]AIY85274.1 hypothetical protein U729_3277 [Clostridium baratii str. Sullivan]